MISLVDSFSNKECSMSFTESAGTTAVPMIASPPHSIAHLNYSGGQIDREGVVNIRRENALRASYIERSAARSEATKLSLAVARPIDGKLLQASK